VDSASSQVPQGHMKFKVTFDGESANVMAGTIRMTIVISRAEGKGDILIK
jgi:hypothetical protein